MGVDPENTPLIESEAQPFLDKQDSWADTIMKALFRYFVLLLICFITFGSYYVYDIPGALKKQLQAWFHINALEYELFYSVYSWPNTIIAFLGGFLIDRVFGVRGGSLIFATLVCIGQVIFALGVQTKLYPLAIIGRFVFGLGGESLSVSQSAYTAKWFSGKELALAFAITISFSRIGSAVNFNVSLRVAKAVNLPMALWLGAFCCVFSLLTAVLLAYFDYKEDKKRPVEEDKKAEEPVKITDVRYFPLSVWLMFIIVVAFYISVFVYITVGTSALQQFYHGLSNTEAVTILGLPYTVSAAASPLFGFAVDLVGRNLSWMLLSTVGQTAVHVGLLFLHMDQIIAWVLNVIMGVMYSMFAACLWPSIAVVVPMRYQGSAYGLSFALQNLGLAAFPLIIGGVVKLEHNSYTGAEWIFVGCAATSFVLTIILFFTDLKNPQLNLSGSEIRARLKAAEMEEAEATSEPRSDLGTINE